MKIKLDENLPSRLVGRLTALGHDVDTVAAEHLTGCADQEIWQAAQSVHRFLITQDLDSSDLRRVGQDSSCGGLQTATGPAFSTVPDAP